MRDVLAINSQNRWQSFTSRWTPHLDWRSKHWQEVQSFGQLLTEVHAQGSHPAVLTSKPLLRKVGSELQSSNKFWNFFASWWDFNVKLAFIVVGHQVIHLNQLFSRSVTRLISCHSSAIWTVLQLQIASIFSRRRMFYLCLWRKVAETTTTDNQCVQNYCSERLRQSCLSLSSVDLQQKSTVVYFLYLLFHVE